MKENIRRIYKYIAPITILIIFFVHSYSVQTKLQQKEKQIYISLKEFSELAEKTRGIELPFLDKAMIAVIDWILPGAFINKNESLKLLVKHQNEISEK